MSKDGKLVGPGEGRGFGTPFSRITVKADVGDVEFTVFENEFHPGALAPTHVHDVYDEAFYVLEGEMDFIIGSVRRRCPAGSFVLVPRGTSHGFGNPTDRPARMIGICTPGALAMTEEFAKIAARSEGPDQVRQALTEVYRKHRSRLA